MNKELNKFGKVALAALATSMPCAEAQQKLKSTDQKPTISRSMELLFDGVTPYHIDGPVRASVHSIDAAGNLGIATIIELPKYDGTLVSPQIVKNGIIAQIQLSSAGNRVAFINLTTSALKKALGDVDTQDPLSLQLKLKDSAKKAKELGILGSRLSFDASFSKNKIINATLAVVQQNEHFIKNSIKPGGTSSYLKEIDIEGLQNSSAPRMGLGLITSRTLENLTASPIGFSLTHKEPMYGAGLCATVATDANLANFLEKTMGSIAITQRRAHSGGGIFAYKTSGNVIDGIDATAYYTGNYKTSTDLQFINKTNNKLLKETEVFIKPNTVALSGSTDKNGIHKEFDPLRDAAGAFITYTTLRKKTVEDVQAMQEIKRNNVTQLKNYLKAFGEDMNADYTVPPNPTFTFLRRALFTK
jgi:hypothetical protein